MGMPAKPLEQMLNELPAEERHKIEDFTEFLWERHRPKERHKPRFDWVGALKDIEEPLTSVELQHEVSRWRTREP